MLAKPYRLSQATAIYDVRNTGKRFINELYTCFIKPSQTSQFAFVISKKTAPHAVNRNRTKRLLSEAIKEIMPNLQRPVQVVIVAKQDLSEVPLQTITATLEKIFQQAQAI